MKKRLSYLKIRKKIGILIGLSLMLMIVTGCDFSSHEKEAVSKQNVDKVEEKKEIKKEEKKKKETSTKEEKEESKKEEVSAEKDQQQVASSKPEKASNGNKHTHAWYDVTTQEKVWVPKIETVEVWRTHYKQTTGDIICNCGARFKNTDIEGHKQHVVDHILAGEPDNFHWETVWVPEQVKELEQVDNGHYEIKTTHYQYCECGAIK